MHLRDNQVNDDEEIFCKLFRNLNNQKTTKIEADDTFNATNGKNDNRTILDK